MNFQKAKKSTAESCRMNWNLMRDKEFGSFKLLKLKYRKVDQMIQPFCRIAFPQEIRSTLFYFKKFQKPQKSTTASSWIHWNVMNDQEFGSLKVLKLKYRRGDQIIQPFCSIGSSKKLGPPSLIWGICKNLRKVLLNHGECIEM